MPEKLLAIVGATGAGKSTIINLLNRSYEISGGRILVDGMDVKDITLKSLTVRNCDRSAGCFSFCRYHFEQYYPK